MTLSDHKITDAAIAEKGVVAAPDQLSGSARTNKMLFDRLIREAVKEDYNGLIDALMAATGAGEIGAAVDGLTGATIQAILNSIKTALDSKVSSAVTEAALELKSDKAVTNKHIKSVELDEATGTFTFTRENGTKIVIDTALEKVAVNFTYDEDSQSLILTLADGSTETVSLAAFVTTTEFDDSGTIEWSVSGSKVKATVKEGSITDTMLSSALKAMLLGYVNRAAGSATNAAASEKNAAASAAQAREAAADSRGFMAEAGGYAQDAKSEAAKAAGSASAAASRAGAAGSSATRAASSAASAAESIKHTPRINSDGKWELWDATKNAYVATEYTAIGEDGTRGLGWYQHNVGTSLVQAVVWDGSIIAPKWGKGDWLYNPENGNVGLCTSRTDNADGSGRADINYKGTLKGTDGVTPHIGTNGNWYIGDTDTGVKAASVYYVDISGTNDDITGSKTFAEIKAAYEANNVVVARQNIAIYALTYISDTRAEFTRVDATGYTVWACSNFGAPSEADMWQFSNTKRVNYDTKYRDIGLKTVPGAIKELQDKSSPAVTDADAGKYLHVNASTKELEWAEAGEGTTPHIGENGNWYIGSTDTGKPSRGAAGEKGDPGAAGAKGDPGEPGAAGKDGITPTIGTNGNWYLGTTDTGEPSRGATGATGAKGDPGNPGKDGTNGITPTIGANGNWYLGATDTGKPSRGATGAKGDPGTDYVLTSADKSEIAALVLAEIPNGDEVAYG